MDSIQEELVNRVVAVLPLKEWRQKIINNTDGVRDEFLAWYKKKYGKDYEC